MNNTQQADLIGKEELSWTDCVIKPDEIIAIRRCTDNGYEDLAVLHFGADEYFIIDISYEKIIQWWTGGEEGDKFINEFNKIFGK